MSTRDLDRTSDLDDRTVAEEELGSAPVRAVATRSTGERGRQGRPGRGVGWRPRKLVLLLGALLFFFGPALALGLGVRAHEVENRRLRSLPPLSSGWHIFDGLTGFGTDHLPLRDVAIHFNTWLQQALFGEVPDYSAGGGSGIDTPFGPAAGGASSSSAEAVPKVVQGRDGWLFFGADFANACAPKATPGQVSARLARLQQIVTASGRRFVAIVAPDKSAIEAQFLPASYPGKDCSGAARSALWPTLSAAHIPGYVDLYQPLLAIQRQVGFPVYRQTDTHWGQRGALVYAEQLANALDPRLWASSRIVADVTVQRVGDLSRLLGTPQVDSSPGFTLDRPGVVRTGDTSSLTQVENLTTGAPLYRPATVLIGDSFSDASRPFIFPLFAQLSYIRNTASPDALIAAIVASHTVVYEEVERSVAWGYDSPLLDQATLDALARALRAHPVGG